MICAEQNPVFLDWASKVLGVQFDPRLCAWITNLSDESILAVVVYNNFSRWNCELSVASSSPKWATRRFIKVAFDYPFRQCGLQRITAAAEPNNHKSISMLERLGFIHEATLKDWFGTQDGLIYRMTKKECTWLTR